MHEFETPLAALAQADDLIVRQRRVAAVDVADHVGVGLQYDVLVDETGAWDRRTAGVDGTVDAVFARPGDHLARGRAILHAAKSDLAEIADAGIGKLRKVFFLHAGLDHWRAGVDLHAADAEVGKARCAVIAIALRPTMSRGRPGV